MSCHVTLDALYEAAFLTDEQFRILDCNDRAIELLRVTSKAMLIGRSIADFPSENTLADEFPTYLKERLTAVPFVVIECRIPRDDGSLFWAETVTHQLSETTYLVTFRDESARIDSLHRAEDANERLRAAIRDRMEFVSNVSHELRTPLTSMSYALTNMLRGICGTLPEKAIGYLERLHVDVKRLMTTVNDLLDLRQMENGTLTLHCATIPLLTLLKEAANALMIQAEMKHQSITITSSPECYVTADRHKIERVFFNIFSNAVKYTPENGAICAWIESQENTVTVHIDDNGIGIPPEALPRVSQRYFRVGDHVAGTGLGLSIVREITELHGGQFSVVSPVPNTTQGTRISITLPRCPAPDLFIVTHETTFSEMVQAALRPLGFTCHTLSEEHFILNQAAFSATSKFIFDGQLSDAAISEMVCKIRRRPDSAQSAILILTDAMEPLLKREFARWRVLVRSRTIVPEELRTLIGN
ncbi:MAG: PAS domain-containing sensor histidine kinase [Kiritimatiellae bacterium]|nr:PAS domain-containing sensor histidine kinase [Kiritimatiellia bacterium]